MQVNDKMITYLEDLSFLSLSPDEKSKMAGELNEILNDLVKLADLNTDSISACSNPLDKVNVFRNDETHPSLKRELLLKNAAQKNDEMFIAPKTVDP